MSDRLLDPRALAPLIAALADVLAPLLAAELNGRQAEQRESEPWRVLTLREAAQRLRRSERWVRERKEQIGYLRLDGGALGFDVDDLREFARSRRVGGR